MLVKGGGKMYHTRRGLFLATGVFSPAPPPPGLPGDKNLCSRTETGKTQKKAEEEHWFRTEP